MTRVDFGSRAPLPFLKHAVTRLSGTSRGPLTSLPFRHSVGGERGAAPGISCAAPWPPLPKAGWGKRLPPAYLGHFDKEPVNAENRVRTNEFGPGASNTRA